MSFRYHTFEQANKLGVTGWIRNLQDGRVECLASAPSQQAMDELLAYLKVGPATAKVEKIEIVEVSPEKAKFSDFSIRRDLGPTW